MNKTIEEIAAELYPTKYIDNPRLVKFIIDGKEKQEAFIEGYKFAKSEQPEPEKPTEPKFRVVETWKDVFFIEQLINGNFKRFDTFYYSLKSAKAAIPELKAKAIEDAKYPIIHEVD